MDYRIQSPVPPTSMRSLYIMLEDFRKETMDDTAPKSFEEFMDVHHKTPSLSYGIMGDNNVLLGAVWGNYMAEDMLLGHVVYEPWQLTPHQKMKATKECLRLMFASGMRKIVWMVFADNRAFLIFLKRLGAVKEGVLRQHERRDGSLIDVVMLATFAENIE